MSAIGLVGKMIVQAANLSETSTKPTKESIGTKKSQKPANYVWSAS